MRLASSSPKPDTPPEPRSSEPTVPDRWAQAIKKKVDTARQVTPRVAIVEELLAYLKRSRELFPGELEPVTKYKEYSISDDVLADFVFAELTFVGYRGHFAMMLIRDEFPAGLFTLISTERGPKLVLNSDAGLCSDVVARVCSECC